MRFFKQLLFFALFNLLAFNLCAKSYCDEPITFEDLPQTAKLFIQENFSRQSVTRASYDSKSMDYKYEVSLSDNTLLQFNDEGKWQTIKCENGGIPVHLIPLSIKEYIEDHFTEPQIIKMEKKNGNYEITILPRTKLTFDNSYDHIGTDTESLNTIEE